MTLRDAMRDYIAYIKNQKGFAASTCHAYSSWLNHLSKWLEENGYPDPSLDVFNTDVLRRFFYYCTERRKHRPRTVRGAFLPIQGLGRFLVANGVCTVNPADNIEMPKKDAAIRLTVSDTEVKKLLNACELQRNAKQIALARCMFQILCYAALRSQELLDLCVADVSPKEGKILVRSGKGSKSRTVYIPAHTAAAIAEWLTFRPKDCRHAFLFAFDRSRRIQRNGYMAVFNAVKIAAGLRDAPNVLPHALRHWRATDLLRAGADLRSIQAFLGHASLMITSIYLHTSEEQCRSLANLSNLAPPSPPPIQPPKTEPRRKFLRRRAL